jgi:hypothetical protein
MSNQLFVIKYNYDSVFGLYIDLEKAKNELKNIYNMKPDYKDYDYRINVYNLFENQYIITNITYTYKFDIFTENM